MIAETDKYTYRVTWSEEDQEVDGIFLGHCHEYLFSELFKTNYGLSLDCFYR